MSKTPATFTLPVLARRGESYWSDFSRYYWSWAWCTGGDGNNLTLVASAAIATVASIFAGTGMGLGVDYAKDVWLKKK